MSRLNQWLRRVWLFMRWVPQTYWESFYHLRPRILELGGAAWAIMWGFWVGNTWWDVFPSSPTFRTMGLVAPEWLWGTTVFVIGAGQLLALYNDSLTWRFRISGAAFFLWGGITTLFLMGNAFSTATVTYGMMWTIATIVAAKLWWREKMNDEGEYL